jgi:NAD(P) transhydrogenase subunit beta
MNPNLINFIYLVAAILFILGIKGLTKPKTAVRGNMLSALGMLVAVVVTLTTINDVDFTYVIAGVIVGGIIGGVMALKVQMTSMPQMVALLNGFGGGASLTIALAEYATRVGMAPSSLAHFFDPVVVSSNAFGDGLVGTIAILSIGLTVLIGAVTLTGSLVAFGKLQELIKKSRGLPGGPIGNGLMLAGALFSVYHLVNNPGDVYWRRRYASGYCVIKLLLRHCSGLSRLYSG